MKRLVWFRGKDLRIHDHAPLREASQGAACVFVLDPYFFQPKRAQRLSNRIAFLLESLTELHHNLALRGAHLHVVPGRSIDVIPALAKQFSVDEVVAYRWTEPFGRTRDLRVAQALSVPFSLYEGETLLPPGTLRSKNGTPYAVYTPFAKAFQHTHMARPPEPPPTEIRSIRAHTPVSEVAIPSIASLGLHTSPQRLVGGESRAWGRLDAFLEQQLLGYDAQRDRMGQAGTSRLSQDLKFGTLSPNTIWHHTQTGLPKTPATFAFERQLIWREFAYSNLWTRPELLEQPHKEKWADFPWREDDVQLQAWKTGQTGYPIVDAAARELLACGYVHNRARMIAASFLTKHLRIHYKRGEAHYLQHLTDGDWAQNNAGWQWAAGCGYDAQPYFRVFNPMRQGQRFDPEGTYVRKWVPELAQLSDRFIHAPWTAPAEERRAAKFELGTDYPWPIVDHATAREDYLATARSHLKSPRESD